MKVVLVLALAALASPKVWASATPSLKKAEVVVENLKFEANPRIVNGQEAAPHSLPYMVYLLFVANETSAWACGGGLISQNYVLTAAHCGRGADTAYVYLGAHNTAVDEETQIRQTVPGSNIKVHEDYDPSDIANDIAVIQLAYSVDFTDAIQTVGLPSDPQNDYVGALATASGWGLTDGEGTTPSQVLNYVEMKVMSNEECQLFFGVVIPDKSVCSSGEDQTSVCLGDSGSPLVVDGVAIGVSAFVAKGCILGYPSGWTRVSDYLDWIADNTDVK